MTTNDTATLPVVRVSLDLTPGGVRNIQIHFNTPEEREEAIRRLDAALPQLELLEQVLQGSAT